MSAFLAEWLKCILILGTVLGAIACFLGGIAFTGWLWSIGHHDMGHSYCVASQVPSAWLNMHGKEILIPIHELGVEVKAS